MALRESTREDDARDLAQRPYLVTPPSISAVQYLIMLAVGHPAVGPDRIALIQQAMSLNVTKYTGSPAGAFVHVMVRDGAILSEKRSIRISDIDLVIDGLSNGACTVIFVDDGLINCLELATYDEILPTDWSSRVQGVRMDKRLWAI